MNSVKKYALVIILFSALSIGFAFTNNNKVEAGYDCPGFATPPTSGIYKRFCTDGDGDLDDQGRLVYVTATPGNRAYPGDVIKFGARIFDYNQDCVTDNCFKSEMDTLEIYKMGTAEDVNATSVDFRLYDPSGDVYHNGNSGSATGIWTNRDTASNSVTKKDNPQFAFSGTEYGTWWLRVNDRNTNDYTWMPILYQSGLDTTPTSFYGYTVPKWISDVYEANVEFLGELAAQEGPNRGLFHDSIIEPRITDLGGPNDEANFKQKYAWEDTMQTGFAMKAMFDLWTITGDTRLSDMMNFVIDNSYLNYQGDFNPANNDGNINPGTSPNWNYGNCNDDACAYAYSKAFTAEPFANQEVWFRGKSTWNATGWSVTTSTGLVDISGDQTTGQMVGVYYAWRFLKVASPASAKIEQLENIMAAGSATTGGKSGGWSQKTGTTTGSRIGPLIYAILLKMAGSDNFVGGNNGQIDTWLTSFYPQSVSSNIVASNGNADFVNRGHDIFYNAFALEIYDNTTEVFDGTYDITDLKDSIISNTAKQMRAFSNTPYGASDIPHEELYYRTATDSLYMNSATADGAVNAFYASHFPHGEWYYSHDYVDNANPSNYNFTALQSMIKRAQYDEDYNWLPTARENFNGLYEAMFAGKGFDGVYRLRLSTGILQQIASYLQYHEENASRIDLNTDSLAIDVLNKMYDRNNDEMTLRPWESGTVPLGVASQRNGYIFRVKNDSDALQTITVNSAGTPYFAATAGIKYTADDFYNLSVVPDAGTVDVAIVTWNGTTKKWTESSTTAGTTNNQIGGLTPNKAYDIKVDDVKYATATSNGSGVITFNYNGGFSTRTFEIVEAVIEEEEDSGSTGNGGSGTGGSTGNSNSGTAVGSNVGTGQVDDESEDDETEEDEDETLVPVADDDDSLTNQNFDLRLTLLDKEGNPLVNATVSIGKLNLKATTDENGVVIFEDIPGGTYNLSIDYEGDTYSKVVTVKDDGGTDQYVDIEVDLEMIGGRSLLIYVVIGIIVLMLIILIAYVLTRKDEEFTK